MVIDERDMMDGSDQKLTYDLTYKDVVDILDVIDHSVCRELRIQLEGFEMTVVKRKSTGNKDESPRT